MTQLGSVSLSGLYSEDWLFTFLAASGIDEDSVGMAVTLDTAAANTVKLAGDGDLILGQIKIFEDRVQEGIKLVTVALKGGMTFDVNPDATASSPDQTPAVGDYIVGGTDDDTNKGYVQKSLDNAWTTARVVEVLDSGAKVVAILS